MRFLAAPAVLVAGLCASAQEPGPQAEPAEYGGPAILSRGGRPSVRSGEFARIQPFIAINAIYDSALAATSLDPQGQVPFQEGYGVQASFGATGTHNWRHTVLDLDYRGDLRHYSKQTYYDGTDHTLSLSVAHRLSSRTTFMFGQSAASIQRSFFMPLAGPAAGYDPLFGSLTSDDLFDNRTFALLSSGRLVHQRTARLSFSAGASGFLVRRRSEALVGANGYVASGDLAYRLNRHQTIGVDYSYSSFQYLKQFGSSEIHGAGLSWSARLSRRWELGLRAGGFRAEVSRLRQVTLDPVIAAILGQNVGIETFNRVVYAPQFQAHLTRSFRRQSLSFNYDRIVAPGNGVFLTTNRESFGANYSYSGMRRIGIQIGAFGHSNSSLSYTAGKYYGYGGGAGFNFRLNRSISLVMRGDVRKYELELSNFNRVAFRASVGFAWNPGDFPVAIW